MDYRYMREEVEIIREHLNRDVVDGEWLVTHCEILVHYAENLKRASELGRTEFRDGNRVVQGTTPRRSKAG